MLAKELYVAYPFHRSEGAMAASNSDGFWSSIKRLYSILDRGLRSKVWLLALLTLAGGATEMLTIGSVFPFLALLADQGMSAQGRWLAPAFHALGADSRQQQLFWTTTLFCSAAVAAAVIRIILVHRTQQLVFTFGHRLSVEIQRRTLLQPYAWHSTHNSSEQLATIEKAELATSGVLLPLAQALAATVLIAAVVIVLVPMAPVATIVAGASLGLVYYGLAALARKRLEANSHRLDRAFEGRIRVLQEGLGGIRDIILDGSQESVLERFRSADIEAAQAQANSSFVSTIPRFLVESVGIVIIACLALFLAGRDDGLVSALPILGALALGAQRLLPLAQQVYNGWSNVAANKVVLQDVVRRLELPLPERAESGPQLPFKRALEFRDVSFTYAGRGHRAVSGLNFTIARGARVALVGPTGSGKSTTADILMGLLHPSSGSVLVDDTVLDSGNRQAWMANVAHVPQLPFLADSSIARNIALSADLDMERVRSAAALAQLDGFVESLAEGYETRVGERGARLSGGQLQRLAIARSIYKDAPLMVLDEATNALDKETEAAVLGALDRLQQQGRTIVIISHRASTVERCDSVIRLKNGSLSGDF